MDDAPKPEDVDSKYGLTKPRYTVALGLTGGRTVPGAQAAEAFGEVGILPPVPGVDGALRRRAGGLTGPPPPAGVPGSPPTVVLHR